MTLCKHISRETTLMQKDDNKSSRYLVIVYRQLYVSRQEYLLFRQSTPAQKFMTLFAGAQRITGTHICRRTYLQMPLIKKYIIFINYRHSYHEMHYRHTYYRHSSLHELPYNECLRNKVPGVPVMREPVKY